MSQTYQNHARYSVPYHFIAIPLIIIGIGLSIYALVRTTDLTHFLIAFAFISVLFASAFARYFALRVQDRSARADERLRYYILTGKMLPSELGMGQILALRFAGDEEFPNLVDQVLLEKLSPEEIKRLVKNWRGDYHRI